MICSSSRIGALSGSGYSPLWAAIWLHRWYQAPSCSNFNLGILDIHTPHICSVDGGRFNTIRACLVR